MGGFVVDEFVAMVVLQGDLVVDLLYFDIDVFDCEVNVVVSFVLVLYMGFDFLLGVVQVLDFLQFQINLLLHLSQFRTGAGQFRLLLALELVVLLWN